MQVNKIAFKSIEKSRPNTTKSAENTKNTSLPNNSKIEDAANDMKGATALSDLVLARLNKLNNQEKSIYDYSNIDFSELNGDIKEEFGYQYITQKDAPKNITRTFVSQDGKHVLAISEQSKESGTPIRDINFDPQKHTIRSIIDYDPISGRKIKATYYYGIDEIEDRVDNV